MTNKQICYNCNKRFNEDIMGKFKLNDKYTIYTCTSCYLDLNTGNTRNRLYDKELKYIGA